MEFNKGDIYEFKENHTLDNRVLVPKGTIVKVVDNGVGLIGFEFPIYSDSFHNCAGNTKTGYGYYIGFGRAQALLRKVIIKRNNMEVYKNGI